MSPRIRRLPAEDLAWLGAGGAALLLLAALLWLGPPLSDLYPERGYPFYPEWQTLHVRLEPQETVQYLLAVAVPLLLAAAVLAFGRGRPVRPSPVLPVVCVQAAVIVFAVWMVLEQPGNVTFSFLRAFDPYLLPAGNLLAAPAVGLALCLLALSWDHPRLSTIRGVVTRLDGRPGAALGVAAALTAVWLLPGVITDAGLGTHGLIPPGHLPIEFDEFVAVSNGRTPLVDYVPWYSALLPIALSPLFPLFDWSITSFTVIMSGLSLVALIAVYGALVEVTRRPWVALALYLPLLAMALQPWSTDGAVREFNGVYYATLPERYIGPLVVVWLSALHLRRGRPPIWVLSFVTGLAVVNNLEFGIAALLALAVALPLGAPREIPLKRWLATHLAPAGAGLVGAVIAAIAVIALRSGELPEPGSFGYVARLASRGYGATPIPELGLHWLPYLTYAAALLTAVVRYATRAPDRVLTGMLAFAGAFGLASGGYFVGRSLPWQLWGLFPAWGLALALLGWAAWLALRTARSDRNSLRRVVVGAFAALAGFGLMVISIDRLPLPWQQVDRIAAGGTSAFDNYDQQRFIEERTDPGEPVLILGWVLDHRLAERAGVRNVSPWFGATSLFGPNETRRALEQLEEEGGSRAFVLIDRPEVKSFEEGIAPRVDAMLLLRGYAPVARDPESGTFEWQLQGAE